MLTTVQGEEAGLENLKAGADDSLEKPFNIESLVIRIERLLNRKRPLLTDTDISGHRISRQDREFLDRVKAEIEENLQESEYTIESLCSSMGVSRSGLYKKMMQLTGKSPIEFIRILRLEKGREMLENGETSVSQIAWSVGFSPKQFSKHFKDEYGCLPSEYIHSLTD
jgi:AraC-like DNA-binding protein